MGIDFKEKNMISTECCKCIHEDVCALKSIIKETETQANDSGLGCKHPDVEVKIVCRKFRNDEPLIKNI